MLVAETVMDPPVPLWYWPGRVIQKPEDEDWYPIRMEALDGGQMWVRADYLVWSGDLFDEAPPDFWRPLPAGKTKPYSYGDPTTFWPEIPDWARRANRWATPADFFKLTDWSDLPEPRNYAFQLLRG